MNAERRLTIVVIGAAVLASLVGIVVLSATEKSVPGELALVVTTGLGILTPSPLSKTTVPADPPAARAGEYRPSRPGLTDTR